MWARMVGSMALQHCIRDRQVSSMTFKRQVEAACERNEHHERLQALRSAAMTLECLFRRC
jgi:hypothetical protein